MLTAIHLALFVVTAVAAFALAIFTGYGFVRDRFSLLWTDRLILVGLAAVALTSVVGPALLLSGEQPSDGLHFLYAAVAWLALPVGRVVSASTHSARARGGSIAVSALVLLGVLVRLYMTGSGG